MDAQVVRNAVAQMTYHLNSLPPARFLALTSLVLVSAYWLSPLLMLAIASLFLPVAALLAKGADAPNARREATWHTTDTLTGLTDRSAFLRGLAEFIAQSKAEGSRTAVLFVDIEGFRQINSRFGPALADAALVTIAETLQDVLRGGDLMARIGGGRFAIALRPGRKVDLNAAISVAERVHAAIAEPLSIDRRSCVATAAVGICLADQGLMLQADAVLESAGIAAADAFAHGPSATRNFTENMRRFARAEKSANTEIESALDSGAIRPFFQPQVSTDTGRVWGMEALARWVHPKDGIISPQVFLPVITKSGLSEKLGEKILYHSLRALTKWDRAGYRVPSVGINFSSSELRNPSLVERIKWEVERFNFAPSRIAIEVLESVVDDPDDDVISRNIRALASHGFAIDLDDFGTSRAAIANIRRFGVSRIKIDRSFVTGVDRNREQQMMVTAMIRMADSLGVGVLAEGVETHPEAAKLNSLGCRYAQGFCFAKPMPVDEILAWMRTRPVAAVSAASDSR